MTSRSTTPRPGTPKPKRLRTKFDREMARSTRNRQWRFMERCAEHNPLWFCVWNKERRDEGPDEWRDCLIGGMDILGWMDQHPDWFVKGEWSDERYAMPVSLTDAGRVALAEREKYDMEDVYGGLVEPGYVVTPLERTAA